MRSISLAFIGIFLVLILNEKGKEAAVVWFIGAPCALAATHFVHNRQGG